MARIGTTVKIRMATLNIELRSLGEHTLVRCNGRIVAGEESAVLRSVVESQLTRDLTVDLAEVEAIDAAGIGALVGLQQWASANGRNITLANATRPVQKMMERTGLKSVLQVVDLPSCSLRAARRENEVVTGEKGAILGILRSCVA
jgi:anti-anti-sigma factor